MPKLVVLEVKPVGVEAPVAQPLGRSTRIAQSPEGLRALVPWAVAEATGTPLPPPPSRVLPYTLVGVGAGCLIGGGVLGIQALTQEGQINGELDSRSAGTFDT